MSKPLVKILEKGYQAQIVELARGLGWTLIYHTYNSRRSAEGFPDLCMVHPEKALLLFAEIKGTGGKLSREQAAWGNGIGVIARAIAGSQADGHVLYRWWSPEDWDDVQAVLQGRSREAGGAA